MTKLIHYILSIFLSIAIFLSGTISGTVTGYDGYSREKLLSDSAMAKCDAVVTGDFIQPWLCAYWNEEQWDKHMKMLSDAGITMLIMQNTAETYQGDDKALKGKYSTFYYPSAMAEDKSISTENCDVHKNMLEFCLKYTKKYNMKIWIGLGGNSTWWDNSFTDSEWRNNEVEFINKQADEIYNLYHSEYKDVIGGWYWYHEMYVSADEQYEIYWSDMINDCLSHLTELDKSLPMIFSPFISTFKVADTDRTFECWTYLFENTKFRKGDIFCPQDGFGTLTSTMSLKEIEKRAYAIKYACSMNKNVKLWFDVECFTNDGGSAPMGRFASQLNICSKFADRLVSFSFSHYYNGLNSTQKEYYDDYLAYRKTVK